MIESNLAWNIGDGRRLTIEEDPWIGSAHRHLLPERMVPALREGDNFSVTIGKSDTGKSMGSITET